MVEIQRCQKCGGLIREDAPSGHCPACLLILSLKSGHDAVAVERIGKPYESQFRDYEILEVVGAGGMGVVYKARQRSLQREVALKVLRDSDLLSEVARRRFLVEVEAAAKLDHPNIVPIYELREEQGRHYFTMKLIDGPSLAQKLAENQRFTAIEIAQLMATLARAVDHAHQHGVLHRDLKPNNILFDSNGRAWVADFSVAKLLGPSDANSRSYNLTVSGSVLGTPHYMAPEQAEGRNVTTAADVYSLGAILYELITGRPPFCGGTPLETLRKVTDEEPQHPTTLKAGADRDLTTICLKCLHKAPGSRYATALSLAEDLERFVRREPVLARPASHREKVIRWCQRNPGLSAATIALVLVFLLGFWAVMWQWMRAERKAIESQRNAYVAEVNRAFTELHKGNVAEAKALLEKHVPQTGGIDFRGWEWRHAWLRCKSDELYTLQRDNGPIRTVAISNHIVASASGGQIKIWDLRNRTGIRDLVESNAVRSLALLGGEVIAGLSDGRVVFWDYEKRERVKTITHGAAVRSLAVSRDGKYLGVYCTDSVSVWRLGDYQEIDKLATGQILSLASAMDVFLPGGIAISPDSSSLAYSNSEGAIILWNIHRREIMAEFKAHRAFVPALAFSPDGSLLLSGGFDRTLRIWDVESKKALKILDFDAWLADVEFSPDGRVFAISGADQRVKLFDTQSFTPLKEYTGHSHEIWSVVFAENGQKLVTGSKDQTIKVWAARSSADAETAPLPRDLLETFWPPGGTHMYLAHPDQTFSLLQFNPLQLSGRFPFPVTNVTASTISVDGKLWAGATKKEITLFDLAEARPVKNYSFPHAALYSLSFIGDSTRLAALANDNTCRIWSVPDFKELVVFRVDKERGGRIEYSRSGHVAAIGYRGGSAEVWDCMSGQKLDSFSGDFEVNAANVSHDGTLLAIAADDGKLYLRDVQKKRLVRILAGQRTAYSGVCFSPDGRRLVASGIDGTVRIWDTQILQPLATLEVDSFPISGIDFIEDDYDSLAIFGSGRFFLLRARL